MFLDFILIVLLGFLILLLAVPEGKQEPLIENFSFVKNVYGNIFDFFYVPIYDEMFSNVKRTGDELGYLMTFLSNSKQRNRRILDIGSGTGRHAVGLSNLGMEVVGIEKSVAMIQYAEDKVVPRHLLEERAPPTFIHANALKRNIFPKGSFSHVTCMFFTIYYFKNKIQLIENIKYWLADNGFFILHLVDPLNFDPVLEYASPHPFFSIQKYSRERVRKSSVVYDNFIYNTEFNYNPKVSKFTETFMFKNKQQPPRRQEHSLYLEPVKRIVDKMNSKGFITISHNNMIKQGHEYNYIYFFQKKSIIDPEIF